MNGIATLLAGLFVLWALFMDPVFSDPLKKNSAVDHSQWDVLLFLLLVPLMGLLVVGGAAVLGAVAVVGGMILLTALTVPSTSRAVQRAGREVRRQLSEQDSPLNQTRERMHTAQRWITERIRAQRERLRSSGARSSARSPQEGSAPAFRDARRNAQTGNRKHWILLPWKKRANKDGTSKRDDTQAEGTDRHSQPSAERQWRTLRTWVVSRTRKDPRDRSDRNRKRLSTQTEVHDHLTRTDEPTASRRDAEKQTMDARNHQSTAWSLGVWEAEQESAREAARQRTFQHALERGTWTHTDRLRRTERRVRRDAQRRTAHGTARGQTEQTWGVGDLRTQNRTRVHRPEQSGKSRLSRRALAQRLASEEGALPSPPQSLQHIGLHTRHRAASTRTKRRSVLQ